jgi:hypothetical protein
MNAGAEFAASCAARRTEPIPPAHAIDEIARYDSRLDHFEDGFPFRKPCTPYWRFYCRCGTVGGKRSSESAARAAHARHATEATQR